MHVNESKTIICTSTDSRKLCCIILLFFGLRNLDDPFINGCMHYKIYYPLKRYPIKKEFSLSLNSPLQGQLFLVRKKWLNILFFYDLLLFILIGIRKAKTAFWIPINIKQ